MLVCRFERVNCISGKENQYVLSTPKHVLVELLNLKHKGSWVSRSKTKMYSGKYPTGLSFHQTPVEFSFSGDKQSP